MNDDEEPLISPTTVHRERVGVTVGLIAVVVSVLISLGGVWLWLHNSHVACERTVRGRENGRTMFDFMIGLAPDQDAPNVIAFRTELDKRLPHLECVGWFDTRAVPVKES